MRPTVLTHAVTLLALTAAPAPGQAPDTAGVRSATDGAYSTDQARDGEAVFRRVCAQCHTRPQFSDPSFWRAWTGRTARDLFETIRTQMPQDNPGRLRREEYAAVVAFLLELNGYPSGAEPLAADTAALRRVRIDPRPVNQ